MLTSTRLAQVHTVTLCRVVKSRAQETMLFKTGKENPVFGFLICIDNVEDTTRNLESFA